MTEKELGKALLAVDVVAAPALDPRQLTQKILARDQRRVRMLAWLTTVLWVLAVAGICFLIWGYYMQVVPRLNAYAAGRAHLEKDWEAWEFAFTLVAQILLACVLVLLLAGISTILLVLASRRATLRQINANLVEISEQLKQLRQSPA
jgi:hypothetical protein